VAIAERLQAGIGSRCELAVVPQAGHALHLERPDAFFEVLADFLRRAAEAAPA
jgi:pimeloyl-ACP methyl ester carboxylesterase